MIVPSVVVLPQVTLCRMHESWMGSFSFSLFLSPCFGKGAAARRNTTPLLRITSKNYCFALSLSLAPRFTQSASLSLVFARNSHSLYVHNNCSWSVCSIDRLCDFLSKFQPVFPRVYKTGMMRWASGGRMTFTNNLL